jgi:crossover junction endodeoxyribonuclease RuvC
MRVVGIDLSLTASGIAAIDDTVGIVTVATTVLKSKPDTGTLASRHKRLETIAAGVIGFAGNAHLVLIEGPSYASGGRGTWDRAGLWWWVVSILNLTGVALIEVPPKTRAKWATDKGNAGKSAVAVAMGRMWPEVSLTDDNDSDALALASIGAQLADMDVLTHAWQKDSLSKLVLPDVDHAQGIQGWLRDMRKVQ